MISPADVSGLNITTILDNFTQSAGPVGHWGFSALLEYEAAGRRRRVLLDTGSDRDCFLRNLKELKMDLAGLDAIVLSHGHYDHTSTTVEAVKAAGGQVVLSRTPVEVASGVWATGEVPRRSFETIMELGRSRLVKVEGGYENPDTIPDDQSLFVRKKGLGSSWSQDAPTPVPSTS